MFSNGHCLGLSLLQASQILLTTASPTTHSMQHAVRVLHVRDRKGAGTARMLAVEHCPLTVLPQDLGLKLA